MRLEAKMSLYTASNWGCYNDPYALSKFEILGELQADTVVGILNADENGDSLSSSDN